MLPGVVREVKEIQIPLLAALLLGGCTAKFARALRVGSVTAGLTSAALFPVRLRRPVAVAMYAAEFGCGAALILTAHRMGRGGLADAVRLSTAVLFTVATCALIELRSSHPDAGCGCFGDLSVSPVSWRTIARSALLACAALATIGVPPLQPPHSGAEAAGLIGMLAAELVVIAALSPELGEALDRLGYSEPCELRRLPASRTLTALHRSSQWRRRASMITAEAPVDMWRELCWRYVVFPARLGEREAEIVFAVYLRPHRPAIHAALVDATTSEVLSWPAAPRPPGMLRWLVSPAHLAGRSARAARSIEGARPAAASGPAWATGLARAPGLSRATGLAATAALAGTTALAGTAESAGPPSCDHCASDLVRIPAESRATPHGGDLPLSSDL
jgi:hypothetical protein